MKVNGDLTLTEGGVIENLTLPSGATFPANANMGEKFRLTEALDGSTPAGEYSHDGTDWRNQPTLDEVKTLISTGGVTSTTYFRQILEARVGLGAVAAGSSFFTNGSPAALASNVASIAAASPPPVIWLDPADYPAGTKLRVRSQLYSNVSTAASFAVSLHKITRTGSQTSGTSLAYTVDATVLGLVTHSGPIEIGSTRNVISAEFAMPASAGLYAFVYVQTGAMTANSAAHIVAQLQAKY